MAMSSSTYYNYPYETHVAWSQLRCSKAISYVEWVPTVEVIDVATSNGKWKEPEIVLLQSPEQIEKHVQCPGAGTIRYLSICQKNSWASLDMCQATLHLIMEQHQIMPEFLNVVQCFQDRSSDGEQAFGGTSWKRCMRNSKEIVFVMKYPESNGRTDGADPWSIRQTGIYQSFQSLSRTSIWILLHPRYNSVADARLKSILNSPGTSGCSDRQPLLLGLIVISVYFVNWRAYMAYLEEEEIRLV